MLLLTPRKISLKPPASPLGSRRKHILIVFACLEGSIEILFQISQAEQEREWNIAAKSIFQRAFDHLILLRLIKIQMLAVGEHELPFRFVVTPEHLAGTLEG